MKNIVCDGLYICDKNKYDVNLVSIWSFLIRECGRWTEEYNADLLYDIRYIEKYVGSELSDEDETRIFWIGFRGSGVDHEEFIKCRCNNDYYYRGLYKITVEKNLKKCIVTLEKSSAWDFRKEHNIYV